MTEGDTCFTGCLSILAVYGILIPQSETQSRFLRISSWEPAALAPTPGMMHLTKKLDWGRGSIHKPFTAGSLI
jgi:5-carboxymethyl-2-hydroxymuconate isomerase